MDVQGLISAIETAGGTLKGFINVLIFIAKFLFLTPWGWILIAIVFISILIVRVKNKNGEVTFYSFVGGVTETLFWLYSNISIILIGVFMVFTISLLMKSFDDFSAALRLYKEAKTLEVTLKNLQAERKVLEIAAKPVTKDGTNRVEAMVRYYAYSPVKNKEIMTGEKIYSVEGNRLYVDFGVINFKYSLIEKGEAVNLAFPNKIFSESVPYDRGKSILAAEKSVPLVFKLDEGDIYGLSQKDYDAELSRIISSVTNSETARQLGVRTSYGQAVAVPPAEGKVYTFYSTAAGGVVLR